MGGFQRHSSSILLSLSQPLILHKCSVDKKCVKIEAMLCLQHRAGIGSQEKALWRATVESSGQAKFCTKVHKALKLSTHSLNF